MAEARGEPLPSNSDLVLELQDEADGGHRWCYYYVDHTARTLFWLHKHDVSDFMRSEVREALTELELESCYWYDSER